MSTLGHRLRMAPITWRKTRATSAPSGVLPGRKITTTGLPVVGLIDLDEQEAALAVVGVEECGIMGANSPSRPDDEAALTANIVELARRYRRYGYRRITALLRAAGWQVNRKRVERIWRREGLKVPARQPKRDRLWQADGSCIRLRPERANQVGCVVAPSIECEESGARVP